MSKTLLFLFFCLTLNYSHSMYVIPNNVVVDRGTNYSFQAVTSLPFDKYTLTFDTDSIAFNARRNSTHITVDYDVPNIMKLRIYSCFIETLDYENYVLENATYYFVIGNLTDDELFALFQTNEELEEEQDILKQTLNNTTNISTWFDYEYPESLFEKNFKYIIIIGATLGSCLSFFGVALVQQKHNAKEKIKEKEAKAKKAKKNFAKAQLTKQAVSHSMNIYVAKNIESEIVYVKLLNEWEIESCEKYEKNCDASFFLRPTKEIEDKLDKKDKKKITSTDVIYYRLKEHVKPGEEPNYSEWWYIFSAIVKYLQEKGHIKKNNDLFPVRCNLKKIREELGNVYIEKDKQDFKGLEDEKKEDDTQKKFDAAVEKSKKAPKPNAKTKDTTNVNQIDVDKKLEDKFNTI